MEYQKDIVPKGLKDAIKTKDGFSRYVSLKVGKMTSAVYMVTDFLSDNEPLKWRLREVSLDLVSETDYLIKDRKDSFGLRGLGTLSLKIRHLVTLLDVAYIGGAVSQMNFDVLKQEYQSLLDLIEQRLSENSFRKFTSDEALDMHMSIPGSSINLELSSGRNAVMAGQTKYINKNGEPHTKEGPIGQKDIKKDTVNDLYGLNSKTEKKSLRKEQIMNFLKDKSWTGIADTAKSLADCGPKTVQRELLEMVSLNILKKQGERRWSKYMLT